MKLGNPIHVAILGIAAVGAIAFFVMRLLSGGHAPAHSAAGLASSVGTERGAVVGGLPVEVLRDAFSHPALTKQYLATLPAEKRPHPAPSTPYLPLAGKLSPEWEVFRDALPPAGADGSKPSENAGSARQLDGKPKSKIELKAIMRTTTPLALVTIDGHEDVTAGLGEYIDATYRITQFSQNAVLLTSDEGKAWLFVGHEVTEK